MKATGIVRRIDDLGRVVIPKEIRKTLRIREGDPLEIFTDRQGEVILKKYSPIGEMGAFAKQYADSMGAVGDFAVLITDRDQILATAATGRKDLIGKSISQTLEKTMNQRECVNTFKKNGKSIRLAEGDDYGNELGQLIYPIISEGDVAGTVILVEKEKPLGGEEEKLAKVAAQFLGKQMES